MEKKFKRERDENGWSGEDKMVIYKHLIIIYGEYNIKTFFNSPLLQPYMGDSVKVHLIVDANVLIAFKEGGHLKDLVSFLDQEKAHIELHIADEILREIYGTPKRDIEALPNYHHYAKTEIGTALVEQTKKGVRQYYHDIHTESDKDYLALATAVKVASTAKGEECWFCTNDHDLFQGAVKYLPHVTVKNLLIINVPSLIVGIHKLNGLLISPRKATEMNFNIFEKDEMDNIYKRCTERDITKRWRLQQCQGKFRIYAQGVLELPILIETPRS